MVPCGCTFDTQLCASQQPPIQRSHCHAMVYVAWPDLVTKDGVKHVCKTVSRLQRSKCGGMISPCTQEATSQAFPQGFEAPAADTRTQRLMGFMRGGASANSPAMADCGTSHCCPRSCCETLRVEGELLMQAPSMTRHHW